MNKISYHAGGRTSSHLSVLISRFCHNLPKVRDPEKILFNVTFHMLDIETDLPVFQSWLNKKYASAGWQMNDHRQQLLKDYFYLRQLNNDRTFIARLQGKPVCAIEIYQAIKEEISLYYNSGPGDYGIRLLIPHIRVAGQEVYTCILQACVKHLFNQPYVRKIILETGRENKQENQVAMNTGFQFQQIISQPYGTELNLYCCTRNTSDQ